jgi:hypothetical protein
VYVADDGVGLKVLDATVPSHLREVGSLDSTRDMVAQSVAVSDSFAYMSWGPSRPWLRSISISDPTRPVKTGGVGTFDYPAGLVVRDTLLYVAQPYRSCVLSGDVGDMAMAGNLAYVTSLYLTTIDVARPDSPLVIYQWDRRAQGIDVVDTVLYMADYGLKTASIANPVAPYVLDSAYVDDFTHDVVVVDTLAILGGNTVRIYSVADPRNIRLVGSWTPPGWAYRLLYEPPHIYSACWDAGVCILETTQTGILEPVTPRGRASLAVSPSVTLGPVHIAVPGSGRTHDLKLYDAVGKEVMRVTAGPGKPTIGSAPTVDLTSLPDGVYVLRGKVGGETMTAKVIKTARR